MRARLRTWCPLASLQPLPGCRLAPTCPGLRTCLLVLRRWGLTAREVGATATLDVDTELGGLTGKVDTVQVREAEA